MPGSLVSGEERLQYLRKRTTGIKRCYLSCHAHDPSRIRSPLAQLSFLVCTLHSMLQQPVNHDRRKDSFRNLFVVTEDMFMISPMNTVEAPEHRKRALHDRITMTAKTNDNKHCGHYSLSICWLCSPYIFSSCHIPSHMIHSNHHIHISSHNTHPCSTATLKLTLTTTPPHPLPNRLPRIRNDIPLPLIPLPSRQRTQSLSLNILFPLPQPLLRSSTTRLLNRQYTKMASNNRARSKPRSRRIVALKFRDIEIRERRIRARLVQPARGSVDDFLLQSGRADGCGLELPI